MYKTMNALQDLLGTQIYFKEDEDSSFSQVVEELKKKYPNCDISYDGAYIDIIPHTDSRKALEFLNAISWASVSYNISTNEDFKEIVSFRLKPNFSKEEGLEFLENLRKTDFTTEYYYDDPVDGIIFLGEVAWMERETHEYGNASWVRRFIPQYMEPVSPE